MKLFLYVFATLMTSSVYASDYQFHSLYQKEGFVTERLLPFSIKPKTAGDFTITAVEVLPPCYGMVDLYRPNMILLYCTEATDTSFSLKITRDGGLYKISSPVFEVKKVALISSTPKPTDPGVKSLGRQLYEVNCQSCHKSYAIAKGVTKTTLTNAFAGKAMRNGSKTTAMKEFDIANSPRLLSDSELDALVKFINEEL